MLTVALLAAVLASPATAADPPGLELTLLTFNIRYGTAPDGPDAWPHRREMVAEVLRERQYDAIGLQEALRFQIDEIHERVPGYAEIGAGRDDGRTAGEYSVILYRPERFTVAEAGMFWLSERPHEPGSTAWEARIPRVCTWARLVEKESGRGVYIYNTHWDHLSEPARARSADLIVRHIAGRAAADPVVLMGDFNCGESSGPIRYLKGDAARPDDGHWATAEPPGLVDTYRVLNPGEPEPATFNGFKPALATPGKKIDHVFVEPGAEVLEAWIDRREVDGRFPSDHFPVGAVVRVRGGPAER